MMSKPFEPENPALDLLATLGEIERHCASPRAKGTATGLLKALRYEAEHNYYGSPAYLAAHAKLVARLDGWDGVLAVRAKARLDYHYERLSNL